MFKKYNSVRFVKFSSALISLIEFLSRFNSVRFVKFSSALISLIEFLSRFNSVRFVKFSSALISLIELLESHNLCRFVKFDRALISLIEFTQRPKCVRFVNPASGRRSFIELLSSHNFLRFVAYSKPVRVRTLLLPAPTPTNPSIVTFVIGAPGAKPSASRAAIAKVASRIVIVFSIFSSPASASIATMSRNRFFTLWSLSIALTSASSVRSVMKLSSISKSVKNVLS